MPKSSTASAARRADTGNWREFAASLQAHHVADLFPLLQGQDYRNLCGSIHTHGLLEPIVLDADNRIIDGRNRIRACIDQGVEPRYVSFDSLGFNGDEREYIAAINLDRRHLTDDQRAQIAALIFKDYREIAAAKKAAVGTANLTGTASGNETVTTEKDKRTAVKVAETAKVSQHKAQQALKVVADAPDLAPKVAAGEVKLAEAVKVAEQNNPPKARKPRAKMSDFNVEQHVAALMKDIAKRRRSLAAQDDQNRLITELIAAIEGTY